MNFIRPLKSIKNVGVIITREYAFKSDLKIKWVRPEKISCVLPEKSGDAASLPKINVKDIIPKFKNSKELASAEDIVKSLFTLENNRRKNRLQVYRDIMVKDVQRHPLDYGSMESRLAQMTAQIRQYQDSLKQFPRDKKVKVACKELIEKRKKYLKFLRRWDYKRFEWILEKLDLVYKPPPAEFHWITRKDSLRKLTDIHCENIKQQRLDEYRKLLQSEQIPFLERKLSNLEFIRKEQQECQVAVSVSQEEINAVRKQLESLRLKRESDTVKS